MLIGREQELRDIANALGRSRLVTLTGPGGVGKTTLAKATAATRPADTTMFSDLTSLDGDDLAEGIAGTLWFASFDDLITEVRSRPVLMVLDNCEHLLDASAEVAERLLSSGPRLQILATSRERLDVSGETSILIHPLPTAGSPSPAAELFLEAAATRGLVTTDDQASVDELCRRLDGLPLALELAAARASAMTVDEMLRHLDSRLDLLSRRRSRGPDRHASLAATIAWSYHQLEPATRETFDRLSVIPAPFTVDIAAAVAGGSELAATIVLETLVEQSLLVHEPVAGVSWYRMLETIKAFAAEQLDDEGRAGAESRLLEHLTDRADRISDAGVMTEVVVPIDMERSFRNVHWAVERAIESGDKPTVFRLIAPWWWLEDVGHQSEAAELLERIIAQWPEIGPDTSIAWGLLSVLTRDDGRALELAEIAASSRGLGAAYGERTLGLRDRHEGRFAESLHHFRRGQEAASDSGHHGVALEIGMHSALAHAREGKIDRAVQLLERIVATSSEFALINAWSKDFLAYTLLPRDPERSGELSRSLAPLAAHNTWIRASMHLNLGTVALIADRTSEAAMHLAESIEAFLVIRSRTDIVLTYLLAGALLASVGDIDGATAAIGGDRHGNVAKLGEFEQELLRQLGPLPAITSATAPMPAEEVAARLRKVASGDDHVTSTSNRFLRNGNVWTIAFEGDEIHIRDSKGLADIATLLSRPEVEVAAIDLMGAVVVAGDSGPVSDAAARRQYEQRVRELQVEIDQATDSFAAETAQDELDTLVDHLTAVYGLGGKDRSAGQPAEKARSAVTWRIRDAIKKIAASHSAAGEHLDRSIRTGRFCVYAPDNAVDWDV